MTHRLVPGREVPLREMFYDDDAPPSERSRWLWLVPLTAGFLAVLGYVLSRDPGPGLSLSDRGWLTVSLAAVLMVLLAVHRSAGRMMRTVRLARIVAEYAVVALLAVLLTTSPGTHQTPAKHPAGHGTTAAKTADDACPSIVQVRKWFACVLQRANQKANDLRPPSTTKPKGHAMAPSLAPPLTSRRNL